MQSAQRRRPLSLLRLRSSQASSAPARRRACGYLSVLDLYELDDRLLRCAAKPLGPQEKGCDWCIRILRSARLWSARHAKSQTVHYGPLVDGAPPGHVPPVDRECTVRFVDSAAVPC